MNRIQKLFGESAVVRDRLPVFVPLAIAASLALWSSQRWIRSVNSTSSMAQVVSQLQNELSIQEQFISLAQNEALESRYTDLRIHLPEGEEQAGEWLTRFSNSATAHGFEVRINVGSSERLAGEGPKADLVPVQFDLRPHNAKPGETNCCLRFVSLLRDLESDQFPYQVVRLEMNGSTRGLASASISTRLWILPTEP